MILLILPVLAQDWGVPTNDSIILDSRNAVYYHAREIVYDLDRSIIILRDSSYIRYQEIELFSDSAYYHIKRNQLEAFGNCDLRQTEDSIRGKYLLYNIKNKKALMTGGKTQIDDGYIDGREIYWIDEKTVNSYHGRYTTCSDSPPHYYFYSPRMKLYIGDMVIARPLVLFIEGIPVMAAPFWFVPVSSKRKSGLLPFRAGSSRLFGKYIRDFAYYQVLGDYADLTLQIDAMEKKGIMPRVEAVWDYSPYTRGTAFGSYIRELDSARQRYSVEARSSSEQFVLGSSFNCDMKYLSDNAFQQNYAETTVIWQEKEISSQATVARSLAGIKNTITYERKEIITDSIIYERLPYYTLITPSRTILSLVNYNLTGHVSRSRVIRPESTATVAGANIGSAPIMQQNIFGLFTLSPRTNLDLAIYQTDSSGARNQIRFGHSYSLAATTNFFRVYEVNLLTLHSCLHKIMPKVNFVYTPDFDFRRFPAVPGIPNFVHTKSISFGVDQLFEGKFGEERDKKIFGRIGTHGGYDFLSDSLNRIDFNVELPLNPFPKPITRFLTNINGSVDPYTIEYYYAITNTSAFSTDFFTISVNTSFKEDTLFQVWLSGDLKPSPNWHINYSMRYDQKENRLVDYSIGLTRNLHCWEGTFNFSQLGSDWRYDFKVRIKSIPEIAIGKGLLGYLLE